MRGIIDEGGGGGGGSFIPNYKCRGNVRFLRRAPLYLEASHRELVQGN